MTPSKRCPKKTLQEHKAFHQYRRRFTSHLKEAEFSQVHVFFLSQIFTTFSKNDVYNGKTILFLNFENHFSQRLPKTQNIVSQIFSCVTNIPLMSYELWHMYKSWLSHCVVIAHWKFLPLCHLMHPAYMCRQ